MGKQRVVQGVRVLSSDQIKNLSDHNFRLYRSKVLQHRDYLHQKFQPWGGEVAEPSVQEVSDIKTMDWLANETHREKVRREDLPSRLEQFNIRQARLRSLLKKEHEREKRSKKKERQAQWKSSRN